MARDVVIRWQQTQKVEIITFQLKGVYKMSNQMLLIESLKYLHTLQPTVKCSKPSLHARNLKVQNPHLHLKNNPEIIPQGPSSIGPFVFLCIVKMRGGMKDQFIVAITVIFNVDDNGRRDDG